MQLRGALVLFPLPCRSLGLPAHPIQQVGRYYLFPPSGCSCSRVLACLNCLDCLDCRPASCAFCSSLGGTKLSVTQVATALATTTPVICEYWRTRRKGSMGKLVGSAGPAGAVEKARSAFCRAGGAAGVPGEASSKLSCLLGLWDWVPCTQSRVVNALPHCPAVDREPWRGCPGTGFIPVLECWSCIHSLATVRSTIAPSTLGGGADQNQLQGWHRLGPTQLQVRHS